MAVQRWVLAVLVILIAILIAAIVKADQVSLAWDAVTLPSGGGYRLYLRSGTKPYGSPAWQGTDTTCTIKGLAPGTTYYFIVRAFAGDSESEDSKEVSFRTSNLNINLSEE